MISFYWLTEYQQAVAHASKISHEYIKNINNKNSSTNNFNPITVNNVTLGSKGLTTQAQLVTIVINI